MKLVLHTEVAQDYRQVFARFTRELFVALAPAFPKVRLLRFDGSHTGDVVEIELQTGPLRQRWTSLITEQQETDEAVWFTDEGQELPFPLRHWRHRHLITRLPSGGSRITDDITYGTGFAPLDWVLYPLFYKQFSARAPVYKKYFADVSEPQIK